MKASKKISGIDEKVVKSEVWFFEVMKCGGKGKTKVKNFGMKDFEKAFSGRN